ncbi:LEA type 2 family protein [Leptospira sp. WS58.C1]|uniref:LEA type 2 family protein n=1 Tax=Leptospira cinconiae TaxID=3235173 RepID=UPI00349EE8F1
MIRKTSLHTYIGITLAANLLFGCAQLQKVDLKKVKEKIEDLDKPSFILEKVSIAEINLSEIKLRVDSKVKNPYPIALPATNLEMNILIEGQQFTKAKTKIPNVGGNSNKPVPVDLTFAYNDLVALYKKVPGKIDLVVKVQGVVSLPIPEKYRSVAGAASLDFPFEEERKIPAVLPDIEIRNFKIIKPDPSTILSSAGTEDLAKKATSFLDTLLGPQKKSPGSAVAAGISSLDLKVDTEFQIVLKNRATSRLQFSEFEFDLTLEKEKFLTGQPVRIENQGQESILSVRTSFPLGTVTQGIANAISKRSAAFRLSGKASTEAPEIETGPVLFKFDKSGSFSWN